jgi:AcrR family transcriptional regulator
MPRADADSRIAILDAAERLFAEQGYAATTIKQIGAAAGVNSALLYYYYDSKETLYHELLRERIGELIQHGMSTIGLGGGSEDTIKALVARQAELLRDHPYLPRLIMRELVDHQAAHAHEQVTRIAATIFRGLCEVIRQGQRTGAFRADLDPRFAAISTIAQVVYFAVARPAVGILLGHDTSGPTAEESEAFAVHAATFAAAALRNTAASPSHHPSELRG